MTRILGIDPGLGTAGWGMIESVGNRLRFLGCGVIQTESRTPLPDRLAQIDQELADVVGAWKPDEAAVEITFVNVNPASALKLGMARGVALLVPARMGVPVSEYAANVIKKSIVGAGHAEKGQIGMMVRTLLPASTASMADEADALAIAICHAHHRDTRERRAG